MAKKKTTKKTKKAASSAKSKKLAALAAKNYRINFHHPKWKVVYPKSFDKCEKYFPILEKIYSILDDYDIDGWHHFEPYVELTIWNSRNVPNNLVKQALDSIKKVIAEYKMEILEESPNTTFYADWYYQSLEEAEFGVESMILTAKLAMTFWKYRAAIKKGKGKDRMLMRRYHVLSNQLAYSYADEARTLNLRGIFSAIASTGASMEQATELYKIITGVHY